MSDGLIKAYGDLLLSNSELLRKVAELEKRLLTPPNDERLAKLEAEVTALRRELGKPKTRGPVVLDAIPGTGGEAKS